MQRGALFVLAIINAKRTYQEESLGLICFLWYAMQTLNMKFPTWAPKHFLIYRTYYAEWVRNIDNLFFL